jgi:glycosyltransferase involved in cell wall biosynthesis
LRSTDGFGPSTIDAVKISIVVPAFNEERLLADSLAHIQGATKAFTSLGWEWELIVCDNNSTDRTAAIARAAGVRVVFEPFNQISRARNTGAAAASGDWLVFVDADSHPGEELFGDIAREIRSGKSLAGGATVRMDRKHLWGAQVVRTWNFISRWKLYFAGSLIFVEMAAFRQIGGFNNELFMSEDIDISRRLNQLARETGKQIVILHRHPIVVSARKLKLYSVREWTYFLVKATISPYRIMRVPANIWYDGRREKL